MFLYGGGTIAVVWLGVVKWEGQVANSLGYTAITWFQRRPLRAGAVRIQEEKAT